MRMISRVASYVSILLIMLASLSVTNKAECSASQTSVPVIEKGVKAEFQTDLSTLRKEVISMCSQLIAGKPRESKEQLIADIDAIIVHWNTITETFRDNPPMEYLKDPAWKEYLETALDNFQIMRAKADSNNYRRAMDFCGLNCGLFVTMNQINGVEKVSDRMFMLRKIAKESVAMLLAGNNKGAVQAVKQADAVLVRLSEAELPADITKSRFNTDVSNIKKAFDDLRIAIENDDTKTAVPALKNFIKIFGNVYIQYI